MPGKKTKPASNAMPNNTSAEPIFDENIASQYDDDYYQHSMAGGAKKRESKKKKVMPVSGKSTFRLKNIIDKKALKSN